MSAAKNPGKVKDNRKKLKRAKRKITDYRIRNVTGLKICCGIYYRIEILSVRIKTGFILT